jgi:hypothetical protein
MRVRLAQRKIDNRLPRTRNPQSLRRVKPEAGATAFRVRLGFAAALLIRRFKCAQTPHFLENTLRFELALESLQGAIHWFTFANDHFWHGINQLLISATGEAEFTRPPHLSQISQNHTGAGVRTRFTPSFRRAVRSPDGGVGGRRLLRDLAPQGAGAFAAGARPPKDDRGCDKDG